MVEADGQQRSVRRAVYDALIAESAVIAGATLVTADARAAETYRKVGVEVRLLD